VSTKRPALGERVFDPAVHCGAETNPRFNAAQPCRQIKGMRTDHPGAGHCWLHTGRSPNGERHAQREAAEQAIAKLGVPRGTGDPFVLLAKSVQHAEGYLEATAQVARDAAEPAEGTTPRLGLDIAAEIYEQAIRTAARTGKAAVDADVADRLAALDERAEGLLWRFVRELLERVVPKAQRPVIEAWASQRLGELSAEYEHGPVVH
jgi:hypothetical protein